MTLVCRAFLRVASALHRSNSEQCLHFRVLVAVALNNLWHHLSLHAVVSMGGRNTQLEPTWH